MERVNSASLVVKISSQVCVYVCISIDKNISKNILPRRENNEFRSVRVIVRKGGVGTWYCREF